MQIDLARSRSFAVVVILLTMVLLLGGCTQSPVENGNNLGDSTKKEIPAADPAGEEIELSDSTITDALRIWAYDLSRQYFAESIPAFSEGGKPTFSEMKWYAANLHREALIENEDGTKSVPGDVLEQTASDLFGVSYDMQADEAVALEIGVFWEPSMSELISYRSVPLIDGGSRITMTLKNFNFSEFMYNEHPEEVIFKYDPEETYNTSSLAVYEEMKLTNLSFYEAARQLIVTGRTEALEPATTLTHLVLYMKDDHTLGRFLACYVASHEGDGQYYYPPDFTIPE